MDDLVIIGDSTIAAYSGQNAVITYIDWNTTKYDISAPGQTIAQQKEAWASVAHNNVLLVVMQIGLNDLGPDDTAGTIARLQDLVDTISNDSPDASIIIAKMLPCRQRLLDLHGETLGLISQQKWVDMNEAIAGDGPTPITGVTARVVSHVPLLDDGAGNLAAAYDLGDGIHENNAGREIIADAWQAAIDAL